MDAARSDWRDGFLFVGNQLFLDFLNTRPLMNGTLVEMLPNWPALVRWLRAAELLDQRQAEQLSRRGTATQRAEVLDELLQFRERIRAVVFHLEAGRAPEAAAVAELNEWLARHPSADQLVWNGTGWRRARYLDPRSPRDVVAPLVDHAAALLSGCAPARIRKCEQCVLHFFDTSRNGTRRWCSMQLCGNRAKVKAYAGRKRAER